MEEHPGLDPEVILFGAHLSPRYGQTRDLVGRDGFRLRASLESLISSDTDVGMAKTIGTATLAFADELARDRPDLLLIIADRYEMLAPASVALSLRIPMAHIEGGEISEGAIDDAVRNALTKLAHVHLTPHEPARQRVLAMGEEPWRVHTVGAPSLDHLCHSPLKDEAVLRRELGLGGTGTLIVVAYHPVTLAEDTTRECQALFAALDQLEGTIAFCFPNADAGSQYIIGLAEQFCIRSEHRRIFVNLPAPDYFSLLQCADLMLGNSSSGIMETPSLKLPTVNVGWRQQGRLCAGNIISVEADTAEILDAARRALEPDFARSLDNLENPYGGGDSGERICQVLADLPDRETLLAKRSLP